jgi:hypothetical protein
LLEIALYEEVTDMLTSVKVIELALNKVGSGYHKVRTNSSPEGIVRERVFSYELYHQIRMLMIDDPMLSLCGEIDKSGNIDFEVPHRRNPDFILHHAGHSRNNELVIEVKGTLNKLGIKKDFDTINIFINNYRYKNGIFILYNFDLNQFVSRFLHWYRDDLEQFVLSSHQIYIMCKKDYSDAQVITLKDLIDSNIT